VSFEHALFEDNVVFTGKQYSNNDSGNNDKLQTISDISFSGAHFKKRAYFENRDFRGITNFGKSEGQPTRFDLAPLFYNSKLFQGTTFVDTEFKTSKNDELAAQAFNTLKQLMSQQQSVRDEQFLIKKELDIELLKATGGVHLLYWLYKNISDYGFSAKLPFIYLILIPFTIFCLFYGLLTSWINCKSLLLTYSCQFDVILIKKTIEFSLIQGLPPLGLEKLSDALREDLFKNQLSSLTMIVVLQKLFALPGWFLIALALRNLFKMK
jgi:hypothetical protein